jgi:hypothetical protein
MTTLVVNENVFRRAKMRKLSIFLTLALVLAVGSAFAQTAVVSISQVDGEFAPGQLSPGPAAIHINYDGTGQRCYEPGSPPTHGNWIYTNGFIIHGDADWVGVTSERTATNQRQLVEAGPMSFTTGIVNSLWLKTGGSGDPAFGSPGSALTESGGVTSGPIGGNATGSDTVGILVGLTGTGAADGWNTCTDPSADRYLFNFETLPADVGKFICFDTIKAPLGAWEWVAGAELVVPTYDNGDGNAGTKCWEVFIPPNQPPVFDLCPDPVSFSHCEVGTFTVHATDPDTPPDNPVTYNLVSGPGAVDANTGVWTWSNPDQSGNFVVEIEACDGATPPACSSTNCITNVTVTNAGPSITCPGGSVTVPTGIEKCQTVVTNDDCDVLTVEVLAGVGFDPGNVSVSGNTVCFTPDPPARTVFMTVQVSDGEETATCELEWEVIEGSPYSLQIEKLHNVFQGQFSDVDIILGGIDVNQGIGGFDILIAYDASALSFQEAFPGDIFAECGWEYFTYRYGPDGNCGSGCPSGMARVIGIAETNNGPNHPTGCAIDYVGTLPVSLASLRFLVSSNATFECQYVPIRFFWFDCGDNTLSNHDGSELYLSAQVFDYVNDDDVFSAGQINDGSVGFPTFQGAQDECVNDDPDHGKIAIRNVDFQNGGIDIVCADSIDARGDINLNGIPYEIADAVMLTNYFVSGLSAFGSHIEGSIAASDVNADGLTLSVADLVYLIRVVVGDAQPYPKLNPLAVNYANDNNVLRVDAPMGAVAVTIAGNVTPQNLTDDMDMSFAYDASKNVTRALIFSDVNGSAGRTFQGNFMNTGGSVVDVEFATYEGQPVAAKQVPTSFAVHQNYPNPFNPSTTFSFDMPKAGDWTINVYNVTGQLVENLGGSHEAGIVEVEWNANNYASGIYFYKVTVGDNTETKKAVLIK